MTDNKILFIPLHEAALIPKRQTLGAAGYDIHTIDSGVIPPCSMKTISVGFKLKLYRGILGIVFGRSGLRVKNNLDIKNTYIKNGEEVKITIYNASNISFVYSKNMRIAQLVFAKMADVSQ